MTRNRVIGRDGGLPWRLPDEMAHFRMTTRGRPVLMGRKTFDELKRTPLPKRYNIVLSSQPIPEANAEHAASLDAGLAMARATGAEECFVIGGAVVYAAALPLADRLYRTVIDTELEGDTYFPAFDESNWREVRHERHEADQRHAYPFDIAVLDRIRNES